MVNNPPPHHRWGGKPSTRAIFPSKRFKHFQGWRYNERNLRYFRRRAEQDYGYNTRLYMRSYNATRRALAIYNANRPITYTKRYRQVYSATVQRTLPRPMNLPPNYNPQFPRGLAQGPPTPSAGALSYWKTPSLGYEQRNKDWTIHKPWTENWPPKQNLKEAERQANQQYYEHLYGAFPLMKQPPYIGDVRWLNTQLPKYRGRKIPFWINRLKPSIPKVPDDQPTDPTDEGPPPNGYKGPIPCRHYVWTPQGPRSVPCSQTHPLQKGYVSQAFHKRSKNYRSGRNYRKRFSNYSRRRSRFSKYY